MMSAAVAGTTFRPISSYTTLRDVTGGQHDIVDRQRRLAFELVVVVQEHRGSSRIAHDGSSLRRVRSTALRPVFMRMVTAVRMVRSVSRAMFSGRSICVITCSSMKRGRLSVSRGISPR